MLCADCAKWRGRRLQKKIFAIIRGTKNNCKFITITLRNTPKLDRAAVDRIVRAFAKLRALPFWQARIAGGVYSVECTYNRERCDWHLHLHCIVELRPWPGHRRGWLPDAWVTECRFWWHELTGDSHVIRLDSINKRAVMELVKYVTKSVAFAESSWRVDEFLKAFRSVRRLQTFGSFHGADVSVDIQEPEHLRCACGMCPASAWRVIGIIPASEVYFDAKGLPRSRAPDVLRESAAVAVGLPSEFKASYASEWESLTFSAPRAVVQVSLFAVSLT